MNGPRHSRHRLRGSVAFGATLLLAVACGKPQSRPERAPVSVAVAPVTRLSVPYTVEANGVVTPMQTANVAAQVDGIVTSVDFREGQEVARGQVLFHIDPRPYRGVYDQAVAALARDRAIAENAEGELKRYGDLQLHGYATKEEAETRRATAASAEATVQSDQAAVANAKFNLDNTIVHAPIAGRTGSVLVRAGNLVHANGNTPLVVINQVRPILVRFAVPGTQLPLILQYGAKGGLPVTVVPAGASPPPPPGTRLPPLDASNAASPHARMVEIAKQQADLDDKGALSFIDNAVDTTTGTVQLKASFDNKAGKLWAGQFVSTSLRLFIEDSALVVPAQAVVTGQRGTYVYVVDSANTAQQRPVTVERSANGLTIISAGVREGERVVTDGQSRLTPGAPVDLRSGSDTSSAPAGRSPGGRGRGGRGGRG